VSFKEQIIQNLSKNGFPSKKVSFDLEKLYELADSKNESLNNILDELDKVGTHHFKEGDKIIFFEEARGEQEDMMKKANEAMANMSEDEINKIKEMAENMSDEEKAQMMEQAKKMGLF
jgi:DNA-directed RNA polymerase specialized sigma54-like protein